MACPRIFALTSGWASTYKSKSRHSYRHGGNTLTPAAGCDSIECEKASKSMVGTRLSSSESGTIVNDSCDDSQDISHFTAANPDWQKQAMTSTLVSTRRRIWGNMTLDLDATGRIGVATSIAQFS